MKHCFIALALAVIVAVGVTGCATTTGNPPQITQAQLDKSAVLLKGSVRAGLLLVIQKNGTNAQAYVCAAGEVLNVVLGGTNYAPGALEKRLYALPSKDLKKAEVQLALSTILTAYEIYYSDYVAGRIGGQQVAFTLLSAVRDGAVGACSMSEGGAGP
jgi:hypothetical protein